MDYHKSEIS